MNSHVPSALAALITGVAVIVHLFAPDTVEAQCSLGSLWSNPMPIKVQINTLLDEDLCPNSTCGSFTDIRRTVEAVFNEYYQATAGKIRFVYAGETSEERHAVIDDHIHIFANDCSGGTLAIAAWGGTWGKIRICRSNAGGAINWDTFHPGPGPRSFHSVLLHELGHVIGMDHIEACMSPAPQSIMRTFYGSNASEHLQAPEMAFVHLNYGVRSNLGFPMWTFDGTTWQTGGGSLPGAINVTGRLAASNTRSSGNNVYVAWTHGNVWLSRYTPSSWTNAAVIFFDDPPRPIYHPGVASKDSRVFLTWLGNRDTFTGLQNAVAQVFNDGSSTFEPLQILTAAPATRTANAGVSATYDPESDSFIAIWRGSSSSDRNSITYSVVGASPAPWKLQNPATGNDLKAADTPSIACGPAEVLGEDNCLVAWIDPFHWQRPVRWTQGRVSLPDGQLVLKDIKTHGYVTIGSASVAYWDDGAFPWLIALNQGGTTTYTWRKQASHDANFQDERSIGFSNKTTLPAAGSRVRDTDGRGYVFVLEMLAEMQQRLEEMRRARPAPGLAKE